MQQYPNVFKLLAESQDAVTMQDIINDMRSASIDPAFLPVIEAALAAHPQYIDGLPFAGEDKQYDQLVNTNKGFELLQQFMDFWG